MSIIRIAVGAALIAALAAPVAHAQTSGATSFATETRAECSVKRGALQSLTTRKTRRQVRESMRKIAAPGDGVADSYHCCDADGNCSGAVDALTICPVIKLRCRHEDNACVCDSDS